MNTNKQVPNHEGFFAQFGGMYVAETLFPILIDIRDAYNQCKHTPDFLDELATYRKDFIGRPSPLYYAQSLSNYYGNNHAIYFKREDLNHTGAHKINNCLGQILLAKRMNKKRIIAETGAGQHGVATATVCALFGMECVIFMGTKDMARQQQNVFRMEMLGATIHAVNTGNATLKDAMNAALRDWAAHVDDTYYLVGTAAGPHPFPEMVRDFQTIIGQEAKQQIQKVTGSLPDTIIACIGGGSNAIGIMTPFLDDAVELIGVEAAGLGVESQHTAASINAGRPGVLHGTCTYLLQNDDGQIQEAHSISAGLDYPGIGPEHAYLHAIKRVKYESVTDDEAVEAFLFCARHEGIIPALEPAHALAYLKRYAQAHENKTILLNMCGRGDKDMATISHYLEQHKSQPTT